MTTWNLVDPFVYHVLRNGITYLLVYMVNQVAMQGQRSIILVAYFNLILFFTFETVSIKLNLAGSRKQNEQTKMSCEAVDGSIRISITPAQLMALKLRQKLTPFKSYV